MRRHPGSWSVVSALAVCAVSLLIAGNAAAENLTLVDPGWQVGPPSGPVYPGGVVATGNGQYVYVPRAGAQGVPRGYQQAPVYYQNAQRPVAPPPGYQAAPGYPAPAYSAPGYPAPAPRPRAAEAAPTYYQVVPAPQRPGQAPGYQVVPAPQPRGAPPAPVYYQTAPAAQSRDAVSPPPNYQMAAPPQARGLFQSMSAPQQDGRAGRSASYQEAPAPQAGPPPGLQMVRIETPQGYAPATAGDLAHPVNDPKFQRQVVDYPTSEPPGTIVIDTPNYFLYLVQEGGKALRYGIGVGRPGFTWAGDKEISAKREWPDWYPPDEMIKRRPDLPKYMPGGPNNPLGARALYLGSTLYRIHGSNEPWTIGTQVSSGCIRLRNEDVIDLYDRVKVGGKVRVI